MTIIITTIRNVVNAFLSLLSRRTYVRVGMRKKKKVDFKGVPRQIPLTYAHTVS